MTLLNTYEKIVMNKKYVSYDRKSFWDKYKTISAQICMNCENDLEKHIIYIITGMKPYKKIKEFFKKGDNNE